MSIICCPLNVLQYTGCFVSINLKPILLRGCSFNVLFGGINASKNMAFATNPFDKHPVSNRVEIEIVFVRFLCIHLVPIVMVGQIA